MTKVIKKKFKNQNYIFCVRKKKYIDKIKNNEKKILKLGDNIRGSNSNWKFTGKTAKNFDTHIKKSVPLYDWSHDISLKLSDFSK